MNNLRASAISLTSKLTSSLRASTSSVESQKRKEQFHQLRNFAWGASLPETPRMDSKLHSSGSVYHDIEGFHDSVQEDDLKYHNYLQTKLFSEFCLIPSISKGLIEEYQQACNSFKEAVELRNKYVWRWRNEPEFDTANLWDLSKFEKAEKQNIEYEFVQGVLNVTGFPPPASKDEFTKDHIRLCNIVTSGPCKTFSYHRLRILQEKYALHVLMNGEAEKDASTDDPMDFDKVTKVDTHIHLAAAMTAKHLIDFVRRKFETAGEEVVTEKGETLKDVFQRMHLQPEKLTLHTLDVEADNTFNRFDNFNNKYNMFGSGELRGIFLKTENHLKGKYFAELTRECFDKFEQNNTHAELRVSIYGRKPSEWNELADWIIDFKLYSPNNCWMIQIPRCYSVWKRIKSVNTFSEMITNIFQPLVDATINPASNPKLAYLLTMISGFDSVDDESKLESDFTLDCPPADSWKDNDPCYAYQLYYLWANINALNRLRQKLGLNTFQLRPHCGESGSELHLATAFLTSNCVNHGVNLIKSTPLQYLFFLTQVGIAVSPLSNNSLFLDYKRNPFQLLFQRGLNVSLSTDDPLQFHLTQNPLLEEYAVAGKYWRFSDADLCEIARNSVIQCGFSDENKKRWLGPNYRFQGHKGNDIRFSNVPNIRACFRAITLEDEFHYISSRITNQSLTSTQITIVSPNDSWKATPDEAIAGHLIVKALETRKKYIYKDPRHYTTIDYPETLPSLSNHEHRAINGVFEVYENTSMICQHDQVDFATVHCLGCSRYYCAICDTVLHKDPKISNHQRKPLGTRQTLFPVTSRAEFESDSSAIKRLSEYGPLLTFSHQRIKMLSSKYRLHKHLNEIIEKQVLKLSANTDFEQIMKVDTHLHAASMPTAQHLLTFMLNKIKNHPKDIVQKVNETQVTMGAVFEKMNIKLEHFTLDALDMHAQSHMTFQRFDKFQAKYNPFGSSDLRAIFLKKDNAIGGRYFAELIKEIFAKNEKYGLTALEPRISIYGQSMSDWDVLAKWVLSNKLLSPICRWMVQFPRIYHIMRMHGKISNFQEYLDRLFKPLFEVTRDPSSNPDLHMFLQHISGFDSVDEERVVESPMGGLPTPDFYTSDENPPYAYYLYYTWANIKVLNQYREMRGLNTFAFRPHSGSHGKQSHLSDAFLLADGISHGLVLANNMFLQYLYYLDAIPIAMSPLAEDAVYLKYEQSPFFDMFARGLSVSLSTDNPLQIHTTDEPLKEEYSVAAKMFKLTSTDLSEIALNSVLMSGFDHKTKEAWIGPKFHEGISEKATNVPDIRIQFRRQNWADEDNFLKAILKKYPMPNPELMKIFNSPDENCNVKESVAATPLPARTAFTRGIGLVHPRIERGYIVQLPKTLLDLVGVARCLFGDDQIRTFKEKNSTLIITSTSLLEEGRIYECDI